MDLELPNLYEEMSKDTYIIELLGDKETAVLFYGALCNIDWVKEKKLPEDEKIMEILRTGTSKHVWSCSWRTAGGYIAEIRNINHNCNEDYMNFYCAGNEGTIAPVVRDAFGRLGWAPAPYDDDENV